MYKEQGVRLAALELEHRLANCESQLNQAIARAEKADLQVDSLEEEVSTLKYDYRMTVKEFEKQVDVSAELKSKIESLEAEVKRLKHEIEILRLYGNKDCTAMADDRISKDKQALEDEK